MASSSSAEHAVAALAPRSRRRPSIRAGLALVALGSVVVAVVVLSTRAGGPDRFRSADGAFSIAVPSGWRALDPREVEPIGSRPAAILRREDRRGMIVIHRRPVLERSSKSLTRDLTRQLNRRFEGLQPVGARTVSLRSGPAYVFTFARPAAGTVQSIAVAPLRDRTYTLDAVAGAGAPDVAAQIGAIVRSFETSDPAPRS